MLHILGCYDGLMKLHYIYSYVVVFMSGIMHECMANN